MRCAARGVWGMWTGLMALSAVSAYLVPIRDTDPVREVCSGMYGGKNAYIEVAFDSSSAGQVAMVIYEWKDVDYLGADTPDNDVGGVYRPKTYICTTSAVRSGLCTSSQLGSFITSVPSTMSIDDTSIYTSALRFDWGSFPTPTSPYEPTPEDDEPTTSDSSYETYPTEGADTGESDWEEIPAEEEGSTDEEGTSDWVDAPVDETEGEADGEDKTLAEELEETVGDWRKRQDDEPLDGLSGEEEAADEGLLADPGDLPVDDEGNYEDIPSGDDGSSDESDSGVVPVSSGSEGVTTYSGPIAYAVPKTGYYCVGIVPVTLVGGRSTNELERRQATHAEYNGVVLFKSTFQGELPAVEYPKINASQMFYLFLSLTYFVLGCGWAYLCVKNLSELLPMQYYISGTIVFLIIEMLAQFAYYRYINKHGGGAGSLAFLFVIAILNAARNSLSFFLLLIVSMGLSVVTQSLGAVMGKVRLLTGFHFIFGVLYSVGTVEVELDNAPLLLVLVLIFPLALTLTAFLMWIIISLNGTILHLQARKQRYKLAMFKRLWRILIIAVIAVAAFFVISSMSLSNRLNEDYAPNNWRYRWILLDGSLATIYLAVFTAIAWIWRPSRDNVRFSMSQELAQDEADAEDYEIDALERGGSHQPLSAEDDDEDYEAHGGPNGHNERKGLVRQENVVFAMGEDSEEEDEDGESAPKYRDREGSGSGSGTDQEGARKDRGKDD